MDSRLPGSSSVHGILQARILEWVAVPSSRGSSHPRNQIRVSHGSCIARGFFTAEPLGKLLVYFPASQLVSPCPPSPLPIPLISSPLALCLLHSTHSEHCWSLTPPSSSLPQGLCTCCSHLSEQSLPRHSHGLRPQCFLCSNAPAVENPFLIILSV